jgi:SAM-dependent methyltransferase
MQLRKATVEERRDMPLYDRYSEVMTAHGPFVQRLEEKRQARILDWISRLLPSKQEISALEVGVGIGLFASACRQRGWKYTGIDRNEKMIRALGDKGFPVLVGEVPPLPAGVAPASFDLVYSSFVFEHLADGTHGFQFAHELTKALKPDGLLVLVVPDALSLGLEFWNLDYTHRYPTADRNVSQILLECGLRVEQLIRYRGAGWTGLPYVLARIAGWFYSYRFWQAVLRKTEFPYSVFQYLNQDVLVFICRKPSDQGAS